MEERGEAQYLIGGFFGVFALFVVLIFGASWLDTAALRTSSMAAVVSSVLVGLANGDRAAAGVPALAVNPLLTEAAQEKADDMAEKGYFAHTSPEGVSPWYWFGAVGYSFSQAGENLAVNFTDSDAVEAAWMNSPEHRANILNGAFTEVGIATALGTYQGRQALFVVQEFGTPAAASKYADITEAAIPQDAAEPAFASAAPRSAPAASTAPAAPASLAPAASSSVLAARALPAAPAAPWWERLLASPRVTLEYAYLALAFLILAALAYETELEWKRRHLRHVYAAGALFLFMAALLALADFAVFTHPILAFS
jgi:hypothetical protein